MLAARQPATKLLRCSVYESGNDLAEGSLVAIDPYQPCPCGSGKKIKFCCSADITHDLEKIEEALASQQRMVALDHINRSLAANGDRASLLTYKAMVHLELREYQNAREDVAKLLAVMPDSAAGLALAAMLDCLEGNPYEGVKHLQQAMSRSEGKLGSTTYEALGAVGRSLALNGEPLAARSHLALQVSASGGRDESALATMLELDASGQLPLVAQGLTDLPAPDSSGPLKAADIAEHNAALKLAQQGCWLASVEKLEALAARQPDEPSLWKTIGILRASLADNEAAKAAFRSYAAIASVPRDEAVEAEAVAQFLSDPTEVDLLPEMTLVYSVGDASALKERLLSNKKLQTVPFDPAQFQDENSPPPQGVFLLLDREVPTSAQGLTRDSVPKILGELLLYGKETDRPARVEFVTPKTPDYASKTAALMAVLGDLAGEKLSEDKSGDISNVAAALMVNWRFPDETPADVRKRLMTEYRTAALLSIYPNLTMSVLDGKTPRQAAADPALQNRVLAAILLLELAEPTDNSDYNQLRRALGLPTLEPIDPASVRTANLSPARLVRVEQTKLSDQDLILCYRRSMMLSAVRLLRKFGAEIVNRPNLEGDVDKAEVYELLSRMAGDPDEMLALIHKAQEAATAAGRSPARYLLAELPVRLQRMEQQEFVRLIDTLRTKHINEPGIAQALYSLLSQLGLLRGGPGAMPAGAGAPGMPLGAAPAQQPGGLWTPDQGAAPAAQPAQGKSKLWLPGME